MNNQILCLLAFTLVPTAVHAADYDANIQFEHKITLSVPVSGEVAQVNVSRGDTIKSGDVLLALNKIPFEAAVQQAEAHVSKTAAMQREADRDLQQLNELYERGVLSKVELENGQLHLQRASADHNAAKSQLIQAKYNLEHAVIVAPFDGLVLDVRVRPFESVNNVVSVMPLMTVAEKNKYTAIVLVSRSAANQLKIGASSKVSVGKTSYKGIVSSIAFEPQQNGNKDQRYEVQIKFDSNGKVIRVGEPARVTF